MPADTPKPAADAAMSPTGADIDNDHADERPVDRSQDAPDAVESDDSGSTNPDPVVPDNIDDESGMLGEGGTETGEIDEHGNPRRGETELNTPVE